MSLSADRSANQSFAWPQRLRLLVTRSLSRIGMREEYFLILLSIVIGAATGLLAFVFYRLVEDASALFYGHGDGQDLGWYGGRAWMIVVLPGVCAGLVGLITHYFAREAKGHGVPEVMDAMYRERSVIRPRVAGAKVVASALTIGSGGSAGMEGPIIQIGAAIGSSAGQALRIPPKQMSIVVACGVSAGIAAIFNAPIAGVLFALEIFLKDFSFRTFSPVVFSSVISCSMMHAIRSQDAAIFQVQAMRDAGYVFAGSELPLFMLLGLACAVAAVLYIRLLYACEDLFDGMKIYPPLRPLLGAVGFSLAGVIYLQVSGEKIIPPFYGNGYPLVQQAISQDLLKLSIGWLSLLFILKLFSTCLTLGSGGSGGIFAPSLLMGATIGGALGLGIHQAGLIPAESVPAYSLVGMASLVAACTHAPLTSIVILYEITREPRVILPVMFASIVATFVAQLLFKDSIYTFKLRRRGVRVGSVADLTILRRVSVADVDHQPVQFVHPEDPLQRLIDIANEHDVAYFVVVDEQAVYQGVVGAKDVRTVLLHAEAVSLLVVAEVMRTGVPTVRESDTLDTVLDSFAQCEVEALPVCGQNDAMHIEGLITREDVMARYQSELGKQA